MLKKYRLKRKLTQEQLSKESGVNRRTIEAFESESKKSPSIDNATVKNVFRLAVTLKTPAYKIVTDPKLIKLLKKERKLK